VGVQEPPPHPTPPRATSKVDVDKALLEGETSKEEKEAWKERRRRRGRRRTRGGVTRVATIRADGAPSAGPRRGALCERCVWRQRCPWKDLGLQATGWATPTDRTRAPKILKPWGITLTAGPAQRAHLRGAPLPHSHNALLGESQAAPALALERHQLTCHAGNLGISWSVARV
jgi:hypothetical protein